MNGLLVIDKPEGWTSHDVVARVRRVLKIKRVGHTGTLDPFATGVLVVLVGKATRLAQFLDKDEKEYEALIQFGFETDTGDRTGLPTVKSALSEEAIAERVSSADWDAIFKDFRGEINQIPPMYSAKKVEGKKLYELARKGVTAEREPISVTIHKLEVLHFNDSFRPRSTLRIRVACSAGTYIRTLAEDIGRKLGVGAHLAELRRTRAGRFALADSISIEQLENLEDPSIRLLDIGQSVAHLPEFTLNADRIEKTRNGLPTRVRDGNFSDNQTVRMVDDAGNLIAIGKYDSSESIVRPKIVLV
jgi:tRNA pseudouridine55 synthase